MPTSGRAGLARVVRLKRPVETAWAMVTPLLRIEATRDRRLGDAADREAVGGACASLVCRSSYTCQVSLNARVTMSFSFAFTSGSFQKYSWRPCTHSK